MFNKSARFYDLLYGFKNYAKESEQVIGLVRDRVPQAESLLDVACGTGSHLASLSSEFEVEGLDLDANLLEVAQQKLPGVKLHHADMRKFDLDKKFDVITCLFSSIGFMATELDLATAIQSMARHLNPGGVMLVEPWFAPGQWKVGHQHALFIDEPDLKIARMSEAKLEEDVSVLNFHYLISEPDGVHYEVENHRLGLYSVDQYLHAFRTANLTAEYVEDGFTGRGLYVAQAPTTS